MGEEPTRAASAADLPLNCIGAKTAPSATDSL
jgi:hypothetical protein